MLHYLWKVTSNHGRSWRMWAGWCCAILNFFWAIFELLKTNHPFVTSIMAFTSFGFVDTSQHGTSELVLICTEAVFGYVMLGVLLSLVTSQMARRS